MKFLEEYHREIAAVTGALISVSLVEQLTLLAAVTSFLAGVGVAYFAGPVIGEYAGLTRAAQSLIGLLLGIGGFGLAAAVHAVAASSRTWLPDLVKKFLDRKAGGQ